MHIIPPSCRKKQSVWKENTAEKKRENNVVFVKPPIFDRLAALSQTEVPDAATPEKNNANPKFCLKNSL